MNPYTKAVQALKECVKESLDSDINPSLQSELWRHYQGMKSIANQVNRSNFSFSLDGVDRVMDLYDTDHNIQAAQPVDNISISTGGDDVISFGDYKSQEYRPD
ncbi:hypothetical protein [Synechococcus phage S-8S29]|nr:hypothetical protein [Synechococcus phage S-8S29]